MQQFTNYTETAIGNHLLLNSSMTSPTTVYLSLHTADPTETGAVGELPVANGYAREAISFGAGSNGVYTNDTTIIFTASGGSWGTLTHFAIWDASAAGNALFYAPLTTSKTIVDGDSGNWAVGTITVTFS